MGTQPKTHPFPTRSPSPPSRSTPRQGMPPLWVHFWTAQREAKKGASPWHSGQHGVPNGTFGGTQGRPQDTPQQSISVPPLFPKQAGSHSSRVPQRSLGTLSTRRGHGHGTWLPWCHRLAPAAVAPRGAVAAQRAHGGEDGAHGHHHQRGGRNGERWPCGDKPGGEGAQRGTSHPTAGSPHSPESLWSPRSTGAEGRLDGAVPGCGAVGAPGDAESSRRWRLAAPSSPAGRCRGQRCAHSASTIPYSQLLPVPSSCRRRRSLQPPGEPQQEQSAPSGERQAAAEGS